MSSLYDFLDVEPDASSEEIRGAWRSAIADLDPSDRRFRAYNEAAETLLDADRRAAYDQSLVASQPAEEPDADAPAAQEATGQEATGQESSGQESSGRRWPGRARPERTRTGTQSGRTLPLVPSWLLVGVAFWTALAVVAVAWLWTQPSEASVEGESQDARVAAETAIEPVLSYDYRTLAQDQKDADRYLTPAYQQKYDKAFNDIVRTNAASTKTVVTAKVIDSAIVREGDGRVQVLLFVNRPTTNKAHSEATVFKDQVTVTMVQQDGHWLIDGLQTTPLGQ